MIDLLKHTRKGTYCHLAFLIQLLRKRFVSWHLVRDITEV